jgi:hypothetical protein
MVIRGKGDRVAAHDGIMAAVAYQALFGAVMGAAMGVIYYEIGKRKQTAAFSQIKHTVKVDPFSGLGPGLAAVGCVYTCVYECLLKFTEVFANHSR